MGRVVDRVRKDPIHGHGYPLIYPLPKGRMSNTVTFKRGTTYAGTVTYTPATGGPANLLTTTVTSDIIDSSGAVYHCTITMAGDGLSFVARVSDTTGFSLGTARSDIKFVYGGVTFFCETFRLNVVDQVTN